MTTKIKLMFIFLITFSPKTFAGAKSCLDAIQAAHLHQMVLETPLISAQIGNLKVVDAVDISS